MNKKGFTLVELLAVIVILSIIAIITTPIIISVLNSSKNKLQDQQIKIVEKAAEEWALSNVKKIPKTNTSCYVAINELKAYLSNSENLKDPKTGQTMTGGVVIAKSGKKYTYTYKSNSSELGTECNGA